MSKVIIGLIVAVVGAGVASFGLSDSCSTEIMAKLAPILGMIPGVAFSWWARVKIGGVSKLGLRKK
jgi:hypothetical protein